MGFNQYGKKPPSFTYIGQVPGPRRIKDSGHTSLYPCPGRCTLSRDVTRNNLQLYFPLWSLLFVSWGKTQIVGHQIDSSASLQ